MNNCLKDIVSEDIHYIQRYRNACLKDTHHLARRNQEEHNKPKCAVASHPLLLELNTGLYIIVFDLTISIIEYLAIRIKHQSLK